MPVLRCAACHACVPTMYRYRHLMTDMIDLIPHSKKDSKLDTKNDRNVVNEVADMKVSAFAG